MELPIARESYRPPTEALVRAIRRADTVLARVMAGEAQLEGALAFTNPRRPTVHMANYAAEVHPPEGMDPGAVIDEVLAHFAAAGVTCHHMVPAEVKVADGLAEAIVARGYVVTRPTSVYLLEHLRLPADERLNRELQVIPGRAAPRELELLFRACAADAWGSAVAEDLAGAHMDQLDEPKLEVFLGRLGQRPAGAVTVLSLGQIGVIDTVDTHPEHRRRGVARTLMVRALEFCQRSLFEQVILEAVESNPAVTLYESLGFRRIAPMERFRLP